jgi:hypothetical protein
MRENELYQIPGSERICHTNDKIIGPTDENKEISHIFITKNYLLKNSVHYLTTKFQNIDQFFS